MFGGGGGVRGVDPKERFAGDFDRLFITFVPLLPLSGMRDLLLERLIVVLLVDVIFSELFVKPFNNAMPPLPLRWMEGMLLAKIAMDSRVSSNIIGLLILFSEAKIPSIA